MGVCTHLYALRCGGPQRPPDDLFHHIWQEAGCDQKDYAEPGWTAGQHLHEHIVHPLVVEEGPEEKIKEEFVETLPREFHFVSTHCLQPRRSQSLRLLSFSIRKESTIHCQMPLSNVKRNVISQEHD